MRKERRAGKMIYVGDTEAPTPPWRDRDNREERGQLDYEKCTAAELMFFIQSRGLSMPITTLPKLSTKDALRGGAEESDLESVELNKKDYATILQQADDAAVFDKFLELGPRATRYHLPNLLRRLRSTPYTTSPATHYDRVETNPRRSLAYLLLKLHLLPPPA